MIPVAISWRGLLGKDYDDAQKKLEPEACAYADTLEIFLAPCMSTADHPAT